MALSMAQQTVRRVGPLRAPSASRPAAAARLAPPKAAAFGAGRAMGGVALRAAAPRSHKLAQRLGYSPLVVEAGGRSLGCTKGGSKRKRANKSGYRARMATPAGRKVIKARRKKGRKNLCPASHGGKNPHQK